MDVEKLLERYAAGKRDFSGIDLSGAKLSGFDLRDINLSELNNKKYKCDRSPR
ncbi:pentapeptide repeat-containing protein [Nostoc sp.]|uniref:pentapeptide repeat-containing protein n=1 Tax=Nostoc sp. TaxID=1180 RepID=UPI002FF4DD4F